VLGKTGSGKTFAAKAAIVEPLLERGRRVGIVDPTGAWWGLRSSRDGKGPGFPVLVLGGDHGDLPLPANGGAAVARLLVEQGVNLVADTSHLTVGERTRWFIDFAGTLYRANRAPLHLVLDEAHNFAPQGKVPDPDTGKMLHAANTLASGGRSRGIRLTMITQRPQKLHKDALTSADTLIAMRVLAPHDRGRSRTGSRAAAIRRRARRC
jgi:DNA helicase HerA-like ATPase